MNVQPRQALGDSEASPADRQQSWLRLGAFCCLALLGLTLVVALSRALPAPPRAAFDQATLDRLTALQPEFVLIGNSMVDTRFDEATLRQALRPRRVAVLGMAATKSSVWYLAQKNLVVASGAHPRIIQFFRYHEIMDPRARSSREDHAKLERVSREDDPIVERKLVPPLRQPIARLDRWLDTAAPFRRLHGKVEELPDVVGGWFSRLLWRDAASNVRRHRINELFALRNLRSAEVPPDAAPSTNGGSFAALVEQSFVPDMCQLAKEHGVPLTFVSVRTREAASGVPVTPVERRNLADFADYVRACGAEFYDMHDEAWERLETYGNGDHIAARFRRPYTASFAQHMARIFH